jgi:hypothetical protein
MHKKKLAMSSQTTIGTTRSKIIQHFFPRSSSNCFAENTIAENSDRDIDPWKKPTYVISKSLK